MRTSVSRPTPMLRLLLYLFLPLLVLFLPPQVPSGSFYTITIGTHSNVVLFGLPEFRCIVQTKAVVDSCWEASPYQRYISPWQIYTICSSSSTVGLAISCLGSQIVADPEENIAAFQNRAPF